MMQIFTIGHSNQTPEIFLKLLLDARIEVLVDVRSVPSSKWVTFANKENLKPLIESANIKYIYLGDLLGGRPQDTDLVDRQNGKADYELIRKKEYYQHGIVQLTRLLEQHRVCIMCAEEDPNHCHRNLLVAESLRQNGVKILHIRGNGQVQTDEELWKAKIGIANNQPLLM